MSKKLAAKASLIHLPPLMDVVVEPGERGHRVERMERTEPAEVRAKTAPGSMAVFMASQSAAVKEADELRVRLSAFDGAQLVRPLDPQAIRPSKWANRHEHSFTDAAFLELKADIAAAGTNVQPVCVRALAPGAAAAALAASEPVLNRSTPAGQPAAAEYELVFGHRRHRACLELGLPVQAMIVELSDQALFEAMERENRSRKNLSAWEQGMMYRRALDEGLYPSQRRLAESLGVDVSLVSKSLSLARLPDAVIGAFASPLDIQFRWAQPLAEALQKDPDGVLARAATLRKTGGAATAATAAQVLATLTTAPAGAGGKAAEGAGAVDKRIEGVGGRQVSWVRDARGNLTVKFPSGVLTGPAEHELEAFIAKLLARAGGGVKGKP
jgi:ParB family chromosome partitioning protein